mgnify:FL=1
MFTYKELLKKGENELLASDISDAAIDAWYLFEYVTDMSRASFFIRRNEEIPEEQANAYIEVIEKRKKRIPLQHITGKQEFMGLDFFVNENVLVPRQDTECLVENDMCTGSGCIIISVKKFVQTAECTGADISEKALETALKNADLNNVPVSFIKSDMFENISEKYDIIVSNPPYIRPDVIKTLEPEVREHDPWLALDGGEDGLSFYRILAKEGKKYLNSQGMIFMEIGYDQGQAVKEIFESEGFVDIVIKKDLCKNDRVVIGRII